MLAIEKGKGETVAVAATVNADADVEMSEITFNPNSKMWSKNPSTKDIKGEGKAATAGNSVKFSGISQITTRKKAEEKKEKS